MPSLNSGAATPPVSRARVIDARSLRVVAPTVGDDDALSGSGVTLAVSLNGGESFGLAALDANGDGEGADEALLKYALLPRGLSEVRFQILPQIRTRLFFLSTARDIAEAEGRNQNKTTGALFCSAESPF